jgi:RNA polymerase sigma-70 factor (ECF subfamily)
MQLADLDRPTQRAARPPVRTLDPESLTEHADRLHRAARSMCADAHDAEDLVQETFARLLARPRLVTEESDLGYLLTALRNTRIAQFRTKHRRCATVELPQDFDTPCADPRWQPEAEVRAREVLAALRRLPGDLGAAIMAVDVVGLSLAEAAAASGQQPKALGHHLARARISMARQVATDDAPCPWM